MKRIPKQLAEEMVLDVLSSIVRLPDVKPQFAEESMKIINNPIDNNLFSGILLLKARPKIIDQDEENFQLALASALATFVKNADDDEFLIKSGFDANFIETIQKEIFDSKLEFALMQFVQAWREYGRLEKKYPNVMEFM